MTYQFKIAEQDQTFAFESATNIQIVDGEKYKGEYEVTPSAETQTLETQGLTLNENITIKPIPSNYGLITWDGSILTVS